jgi:hypothetical protein
MQKILLYALSAAALLLGGASAQAGQSCNLGNGVKRVVFLQFDNVHLRRDNPNVPSDLEQIPSLLNFLKGNGVVLANHHTPLISHTSVDIVTSLTGVYGEKFGFAVGNSFGFFDANGNPHFNASFAYWTDLVNEGTTASPIYVPQHVDQRGKVHPAPWVPYTRAGCDFGAFSIANVEFENTTSDVDNVFGPNSPQHNENLMNHDKAVADFEGIAIHCAKGSPLCNTQNAAPDALPDEPNGYNGFSALFGNKYVAPAINKGLGYVLDLDGHHVADSSTPPNDGFPGFDPTPSQSLGYVAQMLEAGVQVVYFYIEDAHDNQQYPGAPANPDGAFGPGEAGYVYQLKAFDAAFAKFFARMKKDGYTPDNTLFVITADENDHFAGNVAQAQPPGCDGVNVACTYPVGAKGEVQGDLSRIYATEFSNTTPFSVHSDDAPTFHIKGNPAQNDPMLTRPLERQAAGLVGFDPAVGRDAKVTQALADHAELALLHMITHDHNRTPNFILFGNPDYYMFATGKTSPFCTPASDSASCFAQSRDHAWNHGDFQREIVRTWLGIVGPGVRNLGETDDLFTDHTDIRPTILSLAHLTDDYAHDGRVIVEIMTDEALPDSLRDHRETLRRLGEAYKEINAPTGKLGIRTLTGISTAALVATSDATYDRLEDRIERLTERRNDIAGKMNAMLEQAAFHGQEIDEDEAERLIHQAEELMEAID